jgi:hypothetical protein
VLIIGTCGEAGYAVIGAERVAGQPSRPSLPSPVIGMARCMQGCRYTVSATNGPGGGKSSTGIRVWMGVLPTGVSSTPSTQVGEISVSERVALRLPLPVAVVAWFVTDQDGP